MNITAEYIESWVSKSFPDIFSLLNTGNYIVATSRNKIRILNKENGIICSEINGDFFKVNLHENYIVTLSTNKKLNIYNLENGSIAYSLSSVDDFKYVNNNIYVKVDDEVFYLQVKKIIKKELVTYIPYLDELFSNKKAIFTTVFNSEIYNLLDNGKLINKSTNESYSSNIINGKAIIGDQFIVVYNSTSFEIINKSTKNSNNKHLDIKDIILSNDKLLVLCYNNLKCINLYNGKIIWEIDGKFKNLILCGSKIAYINNKDQVSLINGRSNIEPPVTKHSIINNVSKNISYVNSNKNFTVLLSCNDKENIGTIYYSLNGSNWEKYSDLITLIEGRNILKYYSEDLNGLDEKVKSFEIELDFTAPKTTIIKNVSAEKNICNVILKSTDNFSGVYKIFYRLEGKTYLYKHPLEIIIPGTYILDYWSVDNKGNIEESKSVGFVIEKKVAVELPTVELPSNKTKELKTHFNPYINYNERRINIIKESSIFYENNKSLNLKYPLNRTNLFPITDYYYELENNYNDSIKIYFRVENNKWKYISSLSSGYITTPYIEGQCKFELKVETYNNHVLIDEFIKEYLIVNKMAFTLKEPLNGSQILLGQENKLQHYLQNIYGEVSVENIRWQSNNIINNTIMYNELGAYSIEGVYNISDEINCRKTFTFNVVEEYEKEKFILEKIDEIKKQTDGRTYGFNKNRNLFEYEVNNGLYDIKINYAFLNKNNLKYFILNNKTYELLNKDEFVLQKN